MALPQPTLWHMYANWAACQTPTFKFGQLLQQPNEFIALLPRSNYVLQHSTDLFAILNLIKYFFDENEKDYVFRPFA